MRDRRVTSWKIAEEVGIGTFFAHSIMAEDFTMKRVGAKFVPKLLTMEQKQLCVEVSQGMLEPLLHEHHNYWWRAFRVQVRYGNQIPVVTVQSSPVTKTKGPSSAQQIQSDADCFYGSRGVLHHEYAPQSTYRVQGNKEYSTALHHLRDVVRCKRPELWSTGNWRIHHDIARAHSSHLIQTVLAKN